jgi:hypothetical protein
VLAGELVRSSAAAGVDCGLSEWADRGWFFSSGGGDVATVEYENGSGTLGVFSRSYDTMGRVTADAGPLVDRAYDYDGLGRLGRGAGL